MPSALSLLSDVLIATPYVVAAALGLLLPALAVCCYARFDVGIAVIFFMYAVEALYMSVGGLQFGITLYYTDLVLVFVGAIAVLRVLHARDVPRRHWAWMLFGAAIFLSLGLGLPSFGSSAGVQARPYFYLFVTATYGMSFNIEARHLRLLFNWLVAFALLLLAITTYRWAVYYLPIRDLLPEGGVYNDDGPIRVIRSYEALVLAEVLVLALFLHRAAGGLALARLATPLLLGFVVVLQHRSVWVATLVGAMAAILIGRSASSRSAEQLFLVVAIVTLTALPLALDDRLSSVGQQVGSSAGNALQGRGTTGERLESWGQIIGKWASGGPNTIAIGQNFGSDTSRYVHEESGSGVRKIVYPAHNFYVQTLSNTGLLGLVSFLIITAYVVRGLYRICASGTGSPETSALLVLILMQLAYYVPYGADYLQSLVFGVAIACVASNDRRRASLASEAGPLRPLPAGSRWT